MEDVGWRHWPGSYKTLDVLDFWEKLEPFHYFLEGPFGFFGFFGKLKALSYFIEYASFEGVYGCPSDGWFHTVG